MRWLSPPERVPGGARQGQIFQADIVEKFQSLPDFLQDPAGDFGLFVIELCRQGIEPVAGLAYRIFCDFTDVMLARNLDGERFGFQPEAAAGRAGMVGLEPCKFLAHPGGFRFTPASFDIADHAFEGLLGAIGLRTPSS